MRKLHLFILISIYLLVQPVSAYPITGNAITTNEKTITAGVTPDSFLYGLDVAIDQLTLLLTFDNTAKAKKGLEIARERLLEVREMALENKFDAMQTAQQHHTDILNTVKSAVDNIEKANSSEEIEEEIEIEKEIEEHETEIETVKGELKIKIEIKGELTPDQQALIDSILSSMENKTGEVKIKIDNKKGETKIKIKEVTGKTDEEIEEEMEEMEEKSGLTEVKREKAFDGIQDAKEKIEEVKKKLTEVNITEVDATPIIKLLDNAETHLSNAENAYNESKYGEAFGQANSAKQLAKNAKKLLERFIEKEVEIKIEVEIEGNKAKIEIEINDTELEYSLETTDREVIISDIMEKTGLSREEILKIIEWKIEEVKCLTDKDCKEDEVCIEGECKEIEVEEEETTTTLPVTTTLETTTITTVPVTTTILTTTSVTTTSTTTLETTTTTTITTTTVVG